MAEYDYDKNRRNYRRRRSQHDPKLAVGGTLFCHGDSGGPLVKWARTERGLRAYQIGIVSAGGCGYRDTAAVFTRLLFLYSLVYYLPFYLIE